MAAHRPGITHDHRIIPTEQSQSSTSTTVMNYLRHLIPQCNKQSLTSISSPSTNYSFKSAASCGLGNHSTSWPASTELTNGAVANHFDIFHVLPQKEERLCESKHPLGRKYKCLPAPSVIIDDDCFTQDGKSKWRKRKMTKMVIEVWRQYARFP